MHTVTFELESGEQVKLYPGDLIGRSPQCALNVQDVRISEYHAAVSTRREGPVLLTLRGRVSVDGKPRTRTSLEPGRRLHLAGFLALKVNRIDALPSLTLHSTESSPPAPLIRVLSIRSDGRPVAWFDPAAPAHVVAEPIPSLLRDGSIVPLSLDTPFTVGTHSYVLREEQPESAPDATADKGQFDQGLRIVVRFDVVQIDGEAGKSVSFDGLAARVLTELAEIKAPVAWSELARILWQAPADAATRHRWDQLLVRIRNKLRAAGLRGDLLRANRNGLVELVLGPLDKVRMRT